MQQHAIPEPVEPQEEEQDALRLQVEQIIAQRLERSNLMKARTGAEAANEVARTDQQAPAPESLTLPDAVLSERFEQEERARELEQQASSAFEPLQDLPQPELQSQPGAGPQEMRRQEERREGDRRQSDRREGERRNMEFLRTEIQWSSTPEPEEKQSFLSGLGKLKPSRFALLGVAAFCAIVAAVLALTGAPAPEPAPVEPVVVETVAAPTARILVATETIGAGKHLDAARLSWRDMPESDVLDAYFVEKTDPDALETVGEMVARYAFLPGDPIRSDKLLDQKQRSLAMVLKAGMRGVSVVITPDSAAGGFIKPDDRVDVVLVMENADLPATRTVLTNVRVLAINAALGPETTGEISEDPTEATKVFEGIARATLELDARSAEVLVQAAANGPLTLMLRSAKDVEYAKADTGGGADQAIRLSSRFWNDTYSPGIE